MSKTRSDLPLRHSDGRWMYDDKRIEQVFQKMSDKRKVKILTRALDYMSNRNIPKSSAIAYALGCSYDDAGFWTRKTQIRP